MYVCIGSFNKCLTLIAHVQGTPQMAVDKGELFAYREYYMHCKQEVSLCSLINHMYVEGLF